MERVTLHRHRKRLELRPVTVIVSEQEIHFPLSAGLRTHPKRRPLDRPGGLGVLG